MGHSIGRHRNGWTLAWLLVLGSLVSACSLFADAAGSDHDLDDHTHEPGTVDEDHSHDGEGKVDHHGNPIYDEEERVYEQVTANGVSVEFTVENFIGVGGRGGELAPRLVEGEHASLQFHVTDPATGQPLAGLSPSVWVDVAGGDRDCTARVAGYRSGAIDRRPLIDLNSYFILALNRDNTISVLDPMIDVAGMTNLYSVILLQGDPGDWAMDGEGSQLFVTLPSLDKLAVIDLDGFAVDAHVDLPGTPVRVAVSPDGSQAWVTLAGDGGAAVVDTASLAVRHLADDAASGAIAFAGDGRAVIGIRQGIVIRDGASGTEVGRSSLPGTPAAIVVGSDGVAFAAQPDAGVISAISTDDGVERERITADRGVAHIGVSPDGRWAVAASPEADTIYVIETGKARMTHAIPVKGDPDQVTFTETAAYVHTSGSPSITVIPLAEIDPLGDVSVLTVPIGDRPFGATRAPVAAGAITAIPGSTAMLIPNPADDVVYYYAEGGQAALGGFQGHTLQPRAVQVVDRSLREPSPGVHTGSIRIPQGRDFVVAFQLAEPEVIHCFTFSARPSEQSLGDPAARPSVEVLDVAGPIVAGAPHELRLRLTRTDGQPIDGLGDLEALVVGTTRGWNERYSAVPIGDGVYAVRLTLPSPGFYQLLLGSPSLGAGFSDLPSRTLQAVAG